MKPSIIAMAVCLAAGGAHAAQIPQKASRDSRVQVVDYDPDNVIEIPIAMGLTTHIVFGTDERHIFDAFGAQVVSAHREGNHLWVKPSAEAGKLPASTNLSIATDKRNYVIKLVYRKNLDPNNDKGAAYQVTIRYPEIEREALLARAQKAALADRLGEASAPVNRHYTKTREQGIALVDAWDDGVRTFFQFRGSVPAVIPLDAAGKPYAVAHTMQAYDTMVVPTVAQRWVLRLGKDIVLGVVNEAFQPGRVAIPNGAVSPNVERVIREPEQ